MPDDLAAIEKRPKSFRLNLADFGVVYKNTFAKGTITDFQKVSDQPLTLKSMVKVQVEGYGKSDYIPLWFCPKLKYWDSLPEADDAQDINQDGLYYENAWMSFRGGDEVKVLMQEGTPKAVLGFFDNVPRVGEVIVKVAGFTYGGSTVGDNYLRVPSRPQPDIIDGKGPDGLLLNLTIPAKYIKGGSGSKNAPTFYTVAGVSSYAKQTTTIILQISAWIVVVGPILYVFVVLAQGDSVTLSTYSIADLHADDYWFTALNSGNADPYISPPVEGVPYGPTSSGSQEPLGVAGIVMAGVYTKELFDLVVELVATIDPIRASESNAQDWWPSPPDGLTYQSPGGVTPGGVPPGLIDLFYKPHTKEELQAEGLWPWPQ